MPRRIRAVAAKGNTYFTSSKGILKSENAAAQIIAAGIPRALDVKLTLVGSGTLLAPNTQRAYRVVWGYRDTNNNLVQGAPSSRFIFSNTGGGTSDVSVLIIPPAEMSSVNFVQVYATATCSTSVDPGDNMQLIIEQQMPTGAVVSYSLTDNVPDSFRGADLYTNEAEEGQAQENDRPPLGRDIEWFNNRLLIANYTDTQQLNLQMVGTEKFVATDTITIGGVVYSAKTVENATLGQFKVFSTSLATGLGLQSLNVEATAKSLCYCINQYVANGGYQAYYNSGIADAPGAIFLEARVLGTSAFTATTSTANSGSMFSPPIPTSGTSFASTADRRVNQIRVSKTNQPEHMPRGNNIIVGGEDEEIQRIIALRSSLIVIKDRSIWRITNGEVGETPLKLDNTCGVSGRDSAAVLNNAIYMVSDQGFVCITENGIQIVGRPIEDKVLAGLEAINAPDHDKYVGVGYERQRYYICAAWDAAKSEITCYKYSPISNSGKGAWTRRRLNSNAFCVNQNRLLYALKSTTGNVLRERKSRRDGNLWYRDYCEEQGTFTIASVSGVTATGVLSNTVDYGTYQSRDPGYGWKIYDGTNQYLVLSSTGTFPNYVLTLNAATSLTTGAKTILRPVPWKFEWAPIVAGNPLGLKQFNEVLVKTDTSNAYAIDAYFSNDLDTKADPVADDWTTAPAPTRVYIPTGNAAEPSATANDFALTPGPYNQTNEFRTLVDPTRAQGEHLTIKLAGGVAEGYVGVKAIVVTVDDAQSTKVRQ